MTLLEQVEQFLYTHPVQHHKKLLLEMVRDAEERYLRRIAELEQDAAIAAMNRAADGEIDFDADVVDGNKSGCQCAGLPEGTACGWCMSQPIYLAPDPDEERW